MEREVEGILATGGRLEWPGSRSPTCPTGSPTPPPAPPVVVTGRTAVFHPGHPTQKVHDPKGKGWKGRDPDSPRDNAPQGSQWDPPIPLDDPESKRRKGPRDEPAGWPVTPVKGKRGRKLRVPRIGRKRRGASPKLVPDKGEIVIGVEPDAESVMLPTAGSQDDTIPGGAWCPGRSAKAVTAATATRS